VDRLRALATAPSHTPDAAIAVPVMAAQIGKRCAIVSRGCVSLSLSPQAFWRSLRPGRGFIGRAAVFIGAMGGSALVPPIRRRGIMSVRLFVGNLSYQATEAEVREHFSAVGPVVFLHLPTDRESGRPRGIAFIEFNDAAQAEEAIRRFHQQPFQGRPLVVNHARARESGPGVRKHTSAPPSPTSPDWATASRVTEPRSPRRGSTQRDFGPDAAPRGQRKPANRRPKPEPGPKGPIRERRSGQFFGGEEDEADDDASSEGPLHSSQE
jgi:cold-inducible RNA-binding protein